MATVGPWMHGDAVGPGLERDARSAFDTRYAEGARIAQKSHLVQVHAERRHRGCRRCLELVQVEQDAAGVQRLAIEMVANQLAQHHFGLGG